MAKIPSAALCSSLSLREMSLRNDLESGFDGIMIGSIDAVPLCLESLQVGTSIENLIDMEKEEKLIESVGGA